MLDPAAAGFVAACVQSSVDSSGVKPKCPLSSLSKTLPTVVRNAMGTLYEEPCVVFVRVRGRVEIKRHCPNLPKTMIPSCCVTLYKAMNPG